MVGGFLTGVDVGMGLLLCRHRIDLESCQISLEVQMVLPLTGGEGQREKAWAMLQDKIDQGATVSVREVDPKLPELHGTK